MKRAIPKTIPTVVPEPAVKKKPSKPVKKTGLSKKDPDYYSKIGAISARKRKMSSAQFSAMAKLSHANRTEYRGGRKKKDADGTALAK